MPPFYLRIVSEAYQESTILFENSINIYALKVYKKIPIKPFDRNCTATSGAGMILPRHAERIASSGRGLQAAGKGLRLLPRVKDDDLPGSPVLCQ